MQIYRFLGLGSAPIEPPTPVEPTQPAKKPLMDILLEKANAGKFGKWDNEQEVKEILIKMLESVEKADILSQVKVGPLLIGNRSLEWNDPIKDLKAKEALERYTTTSNWEHDQWHELPAILHTVLYNTTKEQRSKLSD